MIDGIGHTPTQRDSHAELQARQGWSVASMREQIDSQQAEIDRLKKQLIASRCMTNDFSDIVKKQSRDIDILIGFECENDALKAEIDRLKKDLYEARDFWSRSNHDLSAQLRAAESKLLPYQSRVRNALNLLQSVNCGNVDDAKIRMAVEQFESIDNLRGDK